MFFLLLLLLFVSNATFSKCANVLRLRDNTLWLSARQSYEIRWIIHSKGEHLNFYSFVLSWFLFLFRRKLLQFFRKLYSYFCSFATQFVFAEFGRFSTKLSSFGHVLHLFDMFFSRLLAIVCFVSLFVIYFPSQKTTHVHNALHTTCNRINTNNSPLYTKDPYVFYYYYYLQNQL